MLKSFCNFSLSVAALGLLTCAASAQMASFGPLNEFGFPDTYTDQDGVGMVLATDITDPLLPAMAEAVNLPDPTGPLDVATGNFFGESFYWLGGTTMPTDGANGQALLVMAVEAVWDNPLEAIIDGDQLVFSRIRIRIDVGDDPANAGTYTVTHPFGTEVFEIDAALIAANAGGRVVNWTDDCLHLDIANPSCSIAGGNQFSNVTDPAIASISHFLRWDTGAPVGYVGDPAIPHALTGSPTGDNIFRVEGPNIGGPGIDSIETNLFSVAGKEGSPAVTNAWIDVGGGVVGSDGTQPLLTGTGDLTPGSQFSVDLTGAPPLSLGNIFVGSVAANIPFAGGILVPDPSTGFRRQRLTSAAGGISFGGTFPSPPPGTQFIVQYFVRDAAAAGMFAGSNAITGTVP
jgi:hypothetical protein